VRRPCLAECNAGLTGGFFATFSIILAKQGFAQDETGAVLPLVAQGGAFVLVLFAAGQTLAWVAPRDLWRVAQAAVVAGLATIGLAGSFSVLLAGAALLGTGLALQHLASVHVLARSGADKGRASGIFTFSGTAGTLVGLIGSGVASRFLPLHEVFLAWIPVFLLIAWGLPAAETLRRGWDGLRSAALRSIPALGVLAVVVAAWDLSARFALVPVHIVVPPLVVAETLVDLARSGDLWVHVQASLVRVGIGFAIGALAGNLYGILHGLSPVLRAVAGPTFHLIRQVPTIGWIPLLILAFGIDEPFKIVVIALGVFFPVALATIDGVAGVPRRFLEVADVLRFGAWTRVTRVVLPAALPDIATGLRIGLSRAWMLIVAAELFGADAGVGHLMDWGRQLFQLDLLIAALLLTGLIGFIIDRFIAWMERRFLGWRLPSGA
jgi:sulfonate transport system permease protein